MGKKRRDGRAAKRGNSASSTNAGARNSDGGGLQRTVTGPSGRGRARYERGTYEGEFRGGKPHGKGKMVFDCGDVYDGEWKDGKQHGRGTFTWGDGDVYEGPWVAGKEQGRGTYRWEDGKVYEGEFVGGDMHGRGTLTYSWGSVYEGEFKEGEEHGKGALKYPSGEIFEGIWVHGELANGDDSINFAGDSSLPTADARNYDAAPTAKRESFDGRKSRSHRSQQRRLEAATKKCEHCGVDDYQYKLRVCTGCNLALYCSAACQKAARRSHQRICEIISLLPPRDGDMLVLKYDRDLVDLDACLRYGSKYMDNLKHLGISLIEMSEDDAVKLSTKQLSSLLKSKRGVLDSFLWRNGNTPVPGIGRNGSGVWQELCGLKQLYLRSIAFDDVQSLRDIIDQQRSSLLSLSLPDLIIGWHRAKTRRTVAHAVGSCKRLLKLDLSGCVLMDSDLKVMLQDLPDLRVLHLEGHRDHSQYADNTCGLIARKCPSLQELSLVGHSHITARGIRKIFEGCPKLLSFGTSTRKLSCKDIRSLLDIASQLMLLTWDDGMHISEDELSRIIEATGGRTVIQWSDDDIFEPRSISSKTREKYEHQKILLSDTWGRQADPEVANEWAGIFEC